MTYNVAAAMEQEELGSSASIARRITQLKEQIKALGDVHVGAITEYAALTERCDFLTAQRDDILKAEQSLQDIIERLTKQMEEQFVEGFTRIAELFNQVFQKLFGGGRGILRLAEGEGVLEAGIEIIAQPPGKETSEHDAAVRRRKGFDGYRASLCHPAAQPRAVLYFGRD